MISDCDDDLADTGNEEMIESPNIDSPVIRSLTDPNDDLASILEVSNFEETTTNNELKRSAEPEIDSIGPIKMRFRSSLRTIYSDFEYLERKLQEETDAKNQAVQELNELKSQLEAEQQKVNCINQKEAAFQNQLDALKLELITEKKKTQKYRTAYMAFENIMKNDETQ